MIIWVFFFYTFVFTAKPILGFITDSFKVAFETYKDYIAKFLDWIIKSKKEFRVKITLKNKRKVGNKLNKKKVKSKLVKLVTNLGRARGPVGSYLRI